LFPFSASIKKARSPRAYLTRHLPPTGFLTLPAVYFLLDPLALFHASNTLGVLSSGRFPPNRAFYIFRSRRPSWRWIVPTEIGSALTFRVFLPAGIRHSPALLALHEKAAALLIFNSLRSSPGLPWPAIRGPPLLSLFVCSSRSPHTERSTGSYETTRLAGLRKDCHPF